MTKLTPTNIEYGDLNWSIYPGCLHKPQGKCPVPNCWAEKVSKRRQQDFHKPHLVSELLLAPLHVKKPSTILVNFMGDLFGDLVEPFQRLGDFFGGRYDHYYPPGWSIRDCVFETINSSPQHTFLFLTKAPWNIAKWGEFPDNAWAGVSVCNQRMFDKALVYLTDVEAKHKWLSIEPLLSWDFNWNQSYLTNALKRAGIDWVVIGAQSDPVMYPSIEWVVEIAEAAARADIPIWLKNNLEGMIHHKYQDNVYAKLLRTPSGKLRQELPL